MTYISCIIRREKDVLFYFVLFLLTIHKLHRIKYSVEIPLIQSNAHLSKNPANLGPSKYHYCHSGWCLLLPTATYCLLHTYPTVLYFPCLNICCRGRRGQPSRHSTPPTTVKSSFFHTRSYRRAAGGRIRFSLNNFAFGGHQEKNIDGG